MADGADRVSLLQPDHIQRRYQTLGSWQIRDFPSSRRSVTLAMPNSGRDGARFANKAYRYTFDGVGYARKGQYLLTDGETVPTSAFDEQRAEVMHAEAESPVVVRYEYRDGLTLGGNTRFHKDRIAATSGTVPGTEQRFSFRWSRNQGFWYLPRSRETSWSRGAVEVVAEALRARGIPKVEVAYHSPTEYGLPAPLEPKIPVKQPTPHGWPPVDLDEAQAERGAGAQILAIPRYSAQDYRWHHVRYDDLGRRGGFATNVEGHIAELLPPSLAPFWVLVVNGERVGRGREDLFEIANEFHSRIPELEPKPAFVPVDPAAIAEAQARVADRKARSRGLDDAARAAGVEVCPRAIYSIAPVPVDRAEIKRRGEAFAKLVHAFRDLREVELWFGGRRVEFPSGAVARLNGSHAFPDWMEEPNTEAMTLRWARGRYEAQREQAMATLDAADPAEAVRVLERCVRDVAGGGRRARGARPHARPAELLDLLSYDASTVQPPAPAKRRTLVDDWNEHQAAKPARPWTNVEKTSCFVRNEPGVDVTLCPTPQPRAVATCPPIQTKREEKSKRVMVCHGDDTLLFFGNVTDAQLEGSNMAIRARARSAPDFDPDVLPAADDFAAQERYLDALVPTRRVFERSMPYTLREVEVAAPQVDVDGETRRLDRWKEKPLPADARLTARVRVGAQVMDLTEFVEALDVDLIRYRGVADQRTIDALLILDKGGSIHKRFTANDIGHGVFGGHSLYWLGDREAMVGPVYASGKPAAGRGKHEVLERLSRSLALPDQLPDGWTLEDTVVAALLVGGELRWSAWNSREQALTNRPESSAHWAEPAAVTAAQYEGAFATTVSKLLDAAPPNVQFHVAGPWLGVLYPPDFGRRVQFDPPTGGRLDLDALAEAHRRSRKLSLEHPELVEAHSQPRRDKQRLEWARKYAKANEHEPTPTRVVRADDPTPKDHDVREGDLLRPGQQLWDKRKRRRVIVADTPTDKAKSVRVRFQPAKTDEKPRQVRFTSLAYMSEDDDKIVRYAKARNAGLLIAGDGDWITPTNPWFAHGVVWGRFADKGVRWLAMVDPSLSPLLWWRFGVRLWTSEAQAAEPIHESSVRVDDPYRRDYWPEPRRAGLRSLDELRRDLAARREQRDAAGLTDEHLEQFFAELEGAAKEHGRRPETEPQPQPAPETSVREELAELEPGLVCPPTPPPKSSSPMKPAHTLARVAPRSKPATPRSKPTDTAKLRALAGTLEAKAEQELNANRLENTPRRAGQARHIRERARRELVLARTLRRVADASDSGGLTYVSHVTNKADLAALEVALERAGVERRKHDGVFEYWKPADPEPADIDHARYSRVRSHASTLLELGEQVATLPKLGAARKRLAAAAARIPDGGELEVAEIEALRAAVTGLSKAKIKPAYQVGNLIEGLRKHDRLTRLGIVDTPSLRAALREYLGCCRGHEQAGQDDPNTAQKTALRFTKIPGFFPTPRPVVERMLAAAKLEPGMRVLEPSAGDGAIALLVREHHPDAELDLVERHISLRRLLEAQGFKLVADDFLAYSPEGAGYDRILMNPPFEKRQDIEHIDHALDLLAPGGRLVAIAAGGLDSRDDSKTRELRDRIEALGGQIEALPPGSFDPSGTSVRTVMVVVDQPGRALRKDPRVSSKRDLASEAIRRIHARIAAGEVQWRAVSDELDAIGSQYRTLDQPTIAGIQDRIEAAFPTWVADALEPDNKPAEPTPARSEAMSQCSSEPATAARPPKAKSKPKPTTVKEVFVEHLAKAEAAPKPKAKKKAAKKKASKKKASKQTASKPAKKAATDKGTTKKPSKKAAKKKASSKKATAKAKATPWRHMDFRSTRYRYREAAGELVVERQGKDGSWAAASLSAARAIHARSQSVCTLAAQTLASCNAGKPNRKRVRPTTEQKQAMREFLGL